MTLRNGKKKRDQLSTGGRMAPKSEESSKFDQIPAVDDTLREKQRPPLYNPEDYAIWLKKWGKKTVNGSVSLYSSSSMSDLSDGNRSQRNSFRDYRNPMLSSSGLEMTLRQFGTVSELLAKLKSDLRLAYPSFVQEFVADPLDGITLLLDLLRAIQLSQSNNGHPQQCSTNTIMRLPPAVQRRTLLDELSCLQCLLNCCLRYSEAVRKLTSSSAGLFTLTICIMSNVNKSRIIALQLLSKACEPPTNGHSVISEAMSTLRLRFGEPVRFRFLVGMLSSAGGQVELLAAGLKFLNKFLNTAGSPQQRIYLQAELEQAGFDIVTIKKNIGSSSNCELVFDELDLWEKHYIDIESLTLRVERSQKENDNLKGKLSLLEQKVQVLQEEKGILISLDQCLRDKCSELREEVQSLKSSRSLEIPTHRPKNHVDSTPDDEGISSSERTPTPEEEIQHSNSMFEIYGTRCNAITSHQGLEVQDSDDETTIEDVIQELRDIISNEESGTSNKENSNLCRDIEENGSMKKSGRIQRRMDLDDYALSSDFEIVPSNLLPKPPRKTRSLLHLFIPPEDYEYGNKELFFDNGSLTSDSSFSPMSVSKYCQTTVENKQSEAPQMKKVATLSKRQTSRTSVKRTESFRHLPNALVKTSNEGLDFHTNTKISSHSVEQQTLLNNTLDRTKCKSLDRIEDGLETFVDIIVTAETKSSPFRSKSDSGNVSGTSICRTMSTVYVNNKATLSRKMSTHSEDKQRMFLPSQDQSEVLYYFPRIQEKRNNSSASFLLNRGYSNAGLYSGHINDDHHSYFSRSNEIVGSDCRSSGKLTDFPSGLY
ncbi:multiple wing hairs [Leptinotarsa decemlineata]|uniref:multiple wing hairs n=1 Tax=Leptinotarsa decemlineata TaxID=7539 RepID=UPI003D304409